jgi:membrane protease YdiL (CAAX protease family)
MFVSLIIVLGLMWLRAQLTGETNDSFQTPAGPAHPAIEWIANGDWRTYWLLMAVASLAAPVMEEVMFRGCLYQYLRELTARKRLVVSIIVSAAVSSLIFAAVHPQGLLGIPPLMAIATSLCLLREWRGSLLAPITAHAINNGAVITLAFGLL